MEKNITTEYKKDGNCKVVAPSFQTLMFLKLFARSCYINKMLPEHLGKACQN